MIPMAGSAEAKAPGLDAAEAPMAGSAEAKAPGLDAAEAPMAGSAEAKAPGLDAAETPLAGSDENEVPGADTNKISEAGDILLYMGHGSLRIVTGEGKVIYVDPFAGEGYDLEADLILVTHDHYDHNAVEKVEKKTADCRIITWKEALTEGGHQTFDLGYAVVEAVEAGYNKNHDVKECVGYIITLSDGVTVYVSGDTSRTEQMPLLAEKEIDYAFFCCDGVFNMGPEEAAECAGLVGAKHNIPYHIVPPDEEPFDTKKAEQFRAENLLIIETGEEIELKPAP